MADIVLSFKDGKPKEKNYIFSKYSFDYRKLVFTADDSYVKSMDKLIEDKLMSKVAKSLRTDEKTLMNTIQIQNKGNLTSMEFLEQVFDNLGKDLTEQINSIVTEKNNSVVSVMQYLINNKKKLARYASVDLSRTKKAFEILNGIFEKIKEIYKFFYGLDEIDFLGIFTESYLNTANEKMKDSTLYKYIKSEYERVKQFYNGTILDNKDEKIQKGISATQKLAEQLIGGTDTSLPNAKSVSGRLANFFGKDIGENIFEPLADSTALNAINESTKPLKEGFHSGALTLVQDNIEQDSLSPPSIKADVIYEYFKLLLSTDTSDPLSPSFQVIIGLSSKWYSDTRGNLKFRTFTKNGVERVAGGIHLLTKSPIIRYIELLAKGYKNSLIFHNAYFHENYSNNEQIVSTIEKRALLETLMGSGKAIKGYPNLFDTTTFLVLNGKFYSTLQLFLNAYKRSNLEDSIRFEYEDRVSSSDNKWVGSRKNMNSADAMKRSQAALALLQKMKISIRVSQEFFKPLP